jgi:hypothetical protein
MLKKAEQLATTAQTPDTTGTALTDTIPWDDAVSEGKDILAKIKEVEHLQLRLGELAQLPACRCVFFRPCDCRR